MSSHIICELIIIYKKAIFTNYDNRYYSIITYIHNKFRLNKYNDNILIKDDYINEDELIKLMLEYDIAYINNIEYQLNSGEINSFVG